MLNSKNKRKIGKMKSQNNIFSQEFIQQIITLFNERKTKEFEEKIMEELYSKNDDINAILQKQELLFEIIFAELELDI
jgi:hypothetical protein